MVLLITAAAWTAIATGVLAGATFVVAAIALGQDWIHDRFYHPVLHVSIDAAPPDCLSIPLVWRTSAGSVMSAACVYLRMRVSATGRPARDVEVVAQLLERKDMSGKWSKVPTFLPMNLVWSDFHAFFLPLLNPGIDHFCDLGRIVDPANRQPEDENAALGLLATTTSLHFSTSVDPTQKGNIVPPGEYRLHIAVAASNAPAIKPTVAISLDGAWYPDEAKMLSQGVGVHIVA